MTDTQKINEIAELLFYFDSEAIESESELIDKIREVLQSGI